MPLSSLSIARLALFGCQVAVPVVIVVAEVRLLLPLPFVSFVLEFKAFVLQFLGERHHLQVPGFDAVRSREPYSRQVGLLRIASLTVGLAVGFGVL